MKEDELRKSANCANCNKKIGHTNLPFFWRIKVERFAIDFKAASAQDGLAAMLGGHHLLANIIGPDRNMAEPIMDPVKVTICEDCITKPIIIPAIIDGKE